MSVKLEIGNLSLDMGSVSHAVGYNNNMQDTYLNM